MKRLQILTTAALILFGTVAVAFAADASHGGGPDYMDFFLRVVNFVIVGGIIWYFAGSKIKGFFGGRTRQIQTELEDLAQRRKDAEAKLSDVEKSIANIEQEKQAILDEAKIQGDSLKAAIVKEAEEKAEQIKAQALNTIDSESKAALESVRGEIAEMVVEAAEKILKGKLSEQDHQKLVDEYLTKVVLN